MNLAQLQEQMNKLEPYHTLYNNAHFKTWSEEVQATISAIEHALTMRTFESKEMASHLQMLGLSPPKSQEDELRLYIALKAVLGFWTRKLGLLKTQSGNYDKTKRKILELGRSGDIGNSRSVPSR